MPGTTTARLFNALGLVAALCAGALAARIVWEETWLTWQSGPQMVGFSLAHSNGVMLLLAAPVLLLVWIVAILIRVGLIFRRHEKLSRADRLHCATAAAIVTALVIPYSWWQFLFAGRLSSGPHAADFLTDAAATGDLRTVKALEAHGTPLTAMSNDGQTSLGAAAVGNQPQVIAYLLEKGLGVNTLNASGDSPLDEAIASDSREATAFLQAHGATQIHGSAAKHDSVTNATVDRAIRQLDSATGSSGNPASNH